MLSRIVLLAALAAGTAAAAAPAGLLVGWAAADITPDRPVAIAGMLYTKISKSVKDPLTATVLAIESPGARDGQALLVGMDLIGVEPMVEADLRRRLQQQIPDFDASKLFLNGTHTHTAPESREGRYQIPDGIMTPAQYRAFLGDRLADAAVKAWRGRKPAGVSWGLGLAVVGYNRRAVYADDSARMYGKTNGRDFRRIEGYEDHGVELLYFFDERDRLTGVAVNVSCPAQTLESQYFLSADYWGEVRKLMRERHPELPFVYPMIGAAGDQSPHLLFRQKADERRRKLLGISETEEIGRRIADAIDSVLPAARKDIRRTVPFAHRVEQLQLPVRRITSAEAAAARRDYEHWLAAPETDKSKFVMTRRALDVLRRYERTGSEPPYEVTLHALRLGDIAIATNPFELYLDYGIQMKGRSPAEQTFIVQLAGPGTYLPTAKAVAGGHYGAEPASNRVGPEGGQMLVERTVAAIEALWK